jgi:trimethylamine--corrinoid protein Co-methyltransferase
VSADLNDRIQAKFALLYTKKPAILQAYDKKGAQDIIRMAAEVMGGMERLKEKPHIVMLVCCTSPLIMRNDAAETIIEAAKAGVPMYIESGPMAGATSPVTLSGTVAQANAEILAHIILAKIVNPAVPVIYSSLSRVFDMKYSNVSLGCPEYGLMRSATTQLAKFYNLPSGCGGILSDSHCIDMQLGWEKMLISIMPALSGTNVINGMGMIGAMNTMSCEGMVADNEIAKIVKRIIEGIAVDEERLGYELIEELGPGSTSFLSHAHTFKYFKKELSIPVLSDRSVEDVWMHNGAKDTKTRAKEMVEEALNKYEKPKFSENFEQKFDEIINGIPMGTTITM